MERRARRRPGYVVVADDPGCRGRRHASATTEFVSVGADRTEITRFTITDAGRNAEGLMAKRPTSETFIAAGLPVRERMLLFCVASDTDWRMAGISTFTVSDAEVKGLVYRDAIGKLTLTEHGRAVFQALLSDFK
jgi:hypothetical protein